MLVRIDVTQKDIEDGNSCASRSCPVALAIGRHVRKGIFVAVMNRAARFGEKLRIFKDVELPVQAVVFYRSFDEIGKQSARPFAFDLDIPEEYMEVPACD